MRLFDTFQSCDRRFYIEIDDYAFRNIDLPDLSKLL